MKRLLPGSGGSNARLTLLSGTRPGPRRPGTDHRREDQVSYTGDVVVGGPPDVRERPGVTVTKVAVGPLDNNAYLLRCTATGAGLLIDAANEPDTLLRLIGVAGLSRIVTTHRHRDHWVALPDVRAATGAPVAAHPADAPELPVVVAELISGGDEVRVGDAVLGVIHLRGHTPGSVALAYDASGGPAQAPHLFPADSPVPRRPGHT